MKRFVGFALLSGIIFSACNVSVLKTTGSSGLIWNTALDTPFVGQKLEIFNVTDSTVMETVMTNAAGNFDYAFRGSGKDSIIIRFVKDDGSYPWFVLPAWEEIVTGQENVISMQNYRYAELNLTVTNSLGIYDSVALFEYHPLLNDSIKRTFVIDTVGVNLRAEGFWNYDLHFYRDTIDSVVTFGHYLIFKSANAVPLGSNLIEVAF